jgi:heavy metal sensor kinase
VVLTIAAIAFIQSLLLRDSMIDALDASLLEDARTTLNLISSLPSDIDAEQMAERSRMRSAGSLRELIDDVITEVPDSLTGSQLTDRVISRLIDEILAELSLPESNGVDPLSAIAQRTVSGRRNNLVEVWLKQSYQANGSDIVFFRTQNLRGDTLSKLLDEVEVPITDTISIVGEARYRDEKLRVARASNERFIVFVAFPQTDIQDALIRLTNSYAFLLPVAIMIAVLGGLWLARKALRPIEQIADTAQEISAKNLSQRIDLPGKTDRELVQLTTTLNSMFERLESSFKQVQQFTSDASHELKTPLAIMKGEIEQAMRHMEKTKSLPPEEVSEVLNSMMEEAERMQRIVEGLLLLSRADDRKLPLDKEKINIYNYLESLAEDASILAEDRGLELSTELDPSAKKCTLSVDPTRLYQVVMNLVDNALKYTPPPGKVTVFLRSVPDAVEFGVSDSGSGIGQEDLPRVFQRFFRTDEARTGPSDDSDRSLGLGLAIVKSIVEAHDGSINVTSRKGQGTTFTVTLPQVHEAL